MERHGKNARFHYSAPPLGVLQDEPVEKPDFVRRADSPIEVFQVGAAAKVTCWQLSTCSPLGST